MATHSLTDANAANNTRSTVVAVGPKVMDIALTGMSVPASVVQGNTATIGVTVQNVGQQDVSNELRLHTILLIKRRRLHA